MVRASSSLRRGKSPVVGSKQATVAAGKLRIGSSNIDEFAVAVMRPNVGSLRAGRKHRPPTTVPSTGVAAASNPAYPAYVGPVYSLAFALQHFAWPAMIALVAARLAHRPTSQRVRKKPRAA